MEALIELKEDSLEPRYDAQRGLSWPHSLGVTWSLSFAIEKGGGEGGRVNTARQSNQRWREAPAGAGQTWSELQRGPLANELVPSMVPVTPQHPTARAFLK